MPCNRLCKYLVPWYLFIWKIPTSRLRGCYLRLPSGPRGEESTGGALRVAEHCCCDFQRRLRRLQVRGQMGSYPIKLFYTSNIPIILQENCEYKRCLKTKRQGWNLKWCQSHATRLSADCSCVQSLLLFSVPRHLLLLPLVECTYICWHVWVNWAHQRFDVLRNCMNCCAFECFLRLLYKRFKASPLKQWVKVEEHTNSITASTTSENRLIAVWCGGIFGV